MQIDQTQLSFLKLAEHMAGVGHWQFDLINETLFWSDEIYSIHGVTPDTYQPTLASAVDFYHPVDRVLINTYISRAIETGEGFEFKLRIVRPDGALRQVKSKAQCVTDEDGKVVGVFGIFQDVTEQVAALQKVKQVTVAHNALVDATGDGYWDWMIQEDYEYMSPRFWNMFGYQPQEKEHHPSAWQEMIFEDDLQVALDNYKKHVETKGEHPYEQEVRYRHKNGSTITVLCRGKVVEWDEQGQAVRMIGTHTDITALKQQQRALTASLSFQKLLLKVNTDLVFVKDEESKIMQANQAFLNLYPAHMQDQIIGFTTSEHYDEQQANAFLEEDRKTFREGLSEVIETLDFPDGRRRTLLTKKIRFEDADGTPYLLAVSRDITKLKRIEESLKNANDELEEFTYRTSHDLRSPLISSTKLLEIIQEKLEEQDIDTALEYLGYVNTSLDGLQTLVTDILQMTRLNHSDSVLCKVDIKAFIENQLDKYDYLDGFSKLQFTLDVSCKEPLEVYIDDLSVILGNLISNAIKYQDKDKEHSFLRISASSIDKQLTLHVEDNGVGFPEECRSKIFQMFTRFHPRLSMGSGLGLYMVHKRVLKSGGKIQYTPLRTGSRFTIKLPLSKTP